MNRLDEKVILVTGAASGIGCETVKRCVEAGAKVIATDLRDADDIRKANNLDDSHLCCTMNVADEAGVSAVVAGALEHFGRIDGLVNCAGINGQGAAHQVDVNNWQKVLEINLTGSLITAKHVITAMLEQKIQGAIVNVASMYGMTGGPGNTPYNVSKGGVLQLTRSMAADYGPEGIRVNSVSPGYIVTPMSSGLDAAPAFRDDFIAMHLLKRAGEPREVASAICFLLSEDASFITGANIPVDGGFTSSHLPSR